MKYLFFLAVLIISFSAEAQRKDSVVTYDVVQLTNGYLIKGEIIAFDKEDGDLTFVEVGGRKYFLGKKDYEYFEEDKEFRIKSQVKKKVDLHDRKETEFEFTVGVNVSYFSIGADLSGDNTIYTGFGDRNHSPICVNLGAGKYFTRRHFIGVEVEAPIISDAKIVSANIKYKFQYDPYQKNIALYIPFGIEYTFLRSPIVPFDHNPDNSLKEEFDMTFNAFGLSVGHGFSYIMKNKKALTIDFSLQKYFLVTEKFNEAIPVSELPIADFSLLGFRFGMKINI
ncbi:MAG: hypothetical protein ACI8ZM_002879 [Crocinitomix sp.]|jgi:hypothetical protein